MQIREIIKQSIEKGVKGLQGGTLKVGIEHPADEDHGDYSSNVALKTGVKAGSWRKNC